MGVMKAGEGCMMPIRLLDADCYACPWSFTCSLNTKGLGRRGRLKPVKVVLRPSKTDKVPCAICEKQKETALVKHRTEWHVCEDCLWNKTDFHHVVPHEKWDELRKKVFDYVS